jgi:hypothetical protein
MSGDYSKARCIVAMGNRNTGVSRRCNRGTDSRNDFVRDLSALERLRFLAAAAKKRKGGRWYRSQSLLIALSASIAGFKVSEDYELFGETIVLKTTRQGRGLSGRVS